MVKNDLFWGGNLKTKSHAENDSRNTEEMFHKRNGQKDIKYVKNDTILKRGKNDHFAKAIVGQND